MGATLKKINICCKAESWQNLKPIASLSDMGNELPTENQE